MSSRWIVTAKASENVLSEFILVFSNVDQYEVRQQFLRMVMRMGLDPELLTEVTYREHEVKDA